MTEPEKDPQPQFHLLVTSSIKCSSLCVLLRRNQRNLCTASSHLLFFYLMNPVLFILFKIKTRTNGRKNRGKNEMNLREKEGAINSKKIDCIPHHSESLKYPCWVRTGNSVSLLLLQIQRKKFSSFLLFHFCHSNFNFC
ncbi:hypothetical protein HN873_070781 [Arachis hypogaea]